MFLLFDIGGTNTRLAVSRDGGAFEKPTILHTPADFGAGMEEIKKAVDKLSGNNTAISAVVGGIAGPLDKSHSALINSPNLPGWVKKPLKDTLGALFSAPIYIENDTALVGLGEAVYGAGKGHNIVAYITVSTGVGGVRIVGGKIDENAMGFEIGHQIIGDVGEVECDSCGRKGELETLIGGKYIERKYHKKPYEITDMAMWENVTRYLGYGLNNTAVYWSPDIIVVGGSMMKNPGIKIGRAKEYFYETIRIFPTPPDVVRATLGDVGGLYGALAYVQKVIK